MHQAYAARRLRKSDDLISILENLIGTSNTPKRLMETDRVIALVNGFASFNYKAKHLKSENLKTRLESWAKENGMVVIATSCALLVFASSFALQNSPIAVITESSQNEILITFNHGQSDFLSLQDWEAGLYVTKESSVLENSISEKISSDDEITKMENITAKMIEEYTQAMVKGADILSEDTSLSGESSLELASPKDLALSPKIIVETPDILSERCGVEIVIPSSIKQTGLCRNYTSYTYYYGRWNQGTGQKALSEQWGAAGKPSSNGIATLNDRYLVAVSPKFGSVGDHIDIVLSDGQIILATIADVKGEDATSEWGHVLTKSGAVDIIEWEATGAKSDIDLGSWANVTVDKIINYGKEIVPVYEVEEVEKELEIVNTEEQQYIQLYSEIYGLNEEKVYQILSDMTNNFQDKAYRAENIIGASQINGKTIICTNKEMAILLAVRNIYQNPRAFGYHESDLKTAIPYQTDLTFADQIFYASNVLGVDPVLNYAICQADSSFSSPMFLIKNNPSNLKWNNEFATFPSPMAGFIEEGIELLNYKAKALTGITSIEERYQRDMKQANPMWVSNVIFIYNYVMEHYDTIFNPQSDKTLSDVKIYVLN